MLTCLGKDGLELHGEEVLAVLGICEQGLGSGILPLFLGTALENYGTAKRQECLAKLSDEATEYLWHTSSATFGEAVDVGILLKNVKNSENPDYMEKGKKLRKKQ